MRGPEPGLAPPLGSSSPSLRQPPRPGTAAAAAPPRARETRFSHPLLKTSEGGPAGRAVPELGGRGAAAGSVKRLRRAGRSAACSCAWPAAGGVSAQEAGLRAGLAVCRGVGGRARARPGFRPWLLRRI